MPSILRRADAALSRAFDSMPLTTTLATVTVLAPPITGALAMLLAGCAPAGGDGGCSAVGAGLNAGGISLGVTCVVFLAEALGRAGRASVGPS